MEDCLRKVKLSSKHLLGLINDVLDMSKIESGKMTLNIEVMSLREVMDDIVNIIQPQIKSRNQHFDIFIDQILCEEIYGDGVRLNLRSKTTVNLLPFPFWLSNSMVPPIRLTMLFVMAIPSPVPAI